MSAGPVAPSAAPMAGGGSAARAAGGAAPIGLPGIPLTGRLPGRVPRHLLAPGTLLLAGVEPGQVVGLSEHRRRWGVQPVGTLDQLGAQAADAGVVGAGGAAFPTDRKLASLAGMRVCHVIVNGAEGESASGKDAVLLGHVPHLVLDGAVAAARALGAPRVVVRISADRPDLARSLPAAFAQRRDDLPIELSVGPSSFVAGEATAVVRAIAGGPSLPADLGRPPTLPARWPSLRGPSRDGASHRGRRAAALVSNVETFARLAVASRDIPARSALASASGAVRSPGVAELPQAWTVADLARAAGGVVGSPAVLVTGGWHGRWLPWGGPTAAMALTAAAVASLGGRWGAGAFVWIPEDLPPIRALAAIASELAAGTAGQCGPCWRGLPEVAGLISAVADGLAGRDALDEVMAQVEGRGICAHPTASVSAVRSALDLMGGWR